MDEELYKNKNNLLVTLRHKIIMKKSPKELRKIRDEITGEFNDIIREITRINKIKKTKKKKPVRPALYISDSSCDELE